MLKLNETLKYISSTSLVITSKVSNRIDTYQVRTECGAWSRSKLFENVISNDNVMLKFNANLQYIGSTTTCPNL